MEGSMRIRRQANEIRRGSCLRSQSSSHGRCFLVFAVFFVGWGSMCQAVRRNTVFGGHTESEDRISSAPLWLESLESHGRSEESDSHNQHTTSSPQVFSLQSTRHLWHSRHRRLAENNHTRDLFLLMEQELVDFEAKRHLSRYELAYRIQHGLSLDFDGFYADYDEHDSIDSWSHHLVANRNNSHIIPTKNGTSFASSHFNNHHQKRHRRLAQHQNQQQHQTKPTSKIRTGTFDNYQAIPLSQGYGTHMASVWVGSPKAQRKTVIVDTGSHYTAFPCKGCQNCGQSHHTDPYFDPSQSQTFRELECDECMGGVMCEKGRCRFSQAYTEGSSWEAVQAKDLMYCGGTDVLDSVDPQHSRYAMDFMFGCMTKMSGLFLTQLADGIMGMSAHQATLPKQLWDKGIIEHNMFAMCFRRELGTSKRGVSAGSMTLGGVSTSLDTGPVVYAKNMARAGWFTVFVKNIYVRSGGGQSTVDPDPQSAHSRTVRVNINARVVNSGKGVIVDSGTTDTYLSKSVAPAFKKAWKEATGKSYAHTPIKMTEDDLEKLPTVLVQCHAYSGQKDPSIEDYNNIPGYTGDLDPSAPEDLLIAIPATSYMDYSPSTKMYTSRLYFTETAGGVLGSNTMQGHNVVFDWEHHRVGFAESSCTYDKKDVPDPAEDSGYASDCRVKEPVLTKPCIDSINTTLCDYGQIDIILLGKERWSAIVADPGTHLGKLCVDAANDMKVNDIHKDPQVSCDSRGLCEEVRPCQLSCQQVEKASKVKQSPSDNRALNCGDSMWSACDRDCYQSRIVSEAHSDGKCHEVHRESRPCHIGACTREDPCRSPYSVRLIFGFRGLDVRHWRDEADETIALALSKSLQDISSKFHVIPGDIDLKMARPWFLDDDNPDAAMDSQNKKGKQGTNSYGVKVVIDIAIANNRTNASAYEDDDVEDRWKLLGNFSKRFSRHSRERKCFDEDLFVLAQRTLAVKKNILMEKKFIPRFLSALNAEDGKARKPLFGSTKLLNESRVVAAWSFRNGIDDKVNYLGPKKPWWFGIFRVLHFVTVLVTTSLVLWSVFGVIHSLHEKGGGNSEDECDCRWGKCWPKYRSRDSSGRTSTSDDHDVAQEGVPLVIKIRDTPRHTSSMKRRSAKSNWLP